MTAPTDVPVIRLLGIPISRVDGRGACAWILAEIAAGRGGWVITPNLDILRRLVREEEFRVLCADAGLRLADGMPLVWASRLQGTPLPERVAGSDLIWRLAESAAAESRSVYLLGGNPGSAEGAARVLQERSPSLRIAGMCCPPFGFENDSSALESIDRNLIETAPDIVFVGLGSPKQEHLIRRLRQVLPRAWFLGVGVTFSFTAGEIERAPVWMRRIGLEWCHPPRQGAGPPMEEVPRSWPAVRGAAVGRLDPGASPAFGAARGGRASHEFRRAPSGPRAPR